MTRDDLPKTFYVPALKRGETSQHVQYRDQSMKLHLPVFGNAEKARNWSEWFQNEGRNQELFADLKLQFSGVPVVKQEALEPMFLWMYGKHVINFEPEVGSLFAPGSRQIDMSDKS
ncbi:MAG TPA: hypothetical protein VMI56_26120 [Reyranella sp.]|nr:hypothetical protein [Reyranella sp.]